MTRVLVGVAWVASILVAWLAAGGYWGPAYVAWWAVSVGVAFYAGRWWEAGQP